MKSATVIVYVLGAVAILGVLAGLHQIVIYQAEIAFEDFESKQKLSDIKEQPTPKPVIENKTAAETEK
ncbi:hypothetical protein [Nitrosarchaeum koreense]|uniref:Uncharacterized protein n=1 Tax=Nitrosarchaeum koreense MY1 TaxID=1001994 RepID=F9CWH1_9ARCH|nr:hypothetical protein [Nitrosarchaeum koreense]EGP93623.1 hypothetical protein MY1_0861 [Nitrosarchaeum koreense MY1]